MSKRPLKFQEFEKNIQMMLKNPQRPSESKNAWYKFLGERCECRSRSTLQNIEKATRETGTEDLRKAYEKYNEIIKEQNTKREQEEPEKTAEDMPLPGQIKMDLPPAEETKPEMSDQTKMMRFLAGKFGEGNETLEKSLEHIAMNIDKLNDTMSMILRAIRRD